MAILRHSRPNMDRVRKNLNIDNGHCYHLVSEDEDEIVINSHGSMPCQDFHVFPVYLCCYGPHQIKIVYWLIIIVKTYITYSEPGTSEFYKL